MARNEEKQLARLNRFYLEKQKQEELKKRPPRPRLDTLNTSREIRKWLPTITRDIEFYVKQMEVTCYTDRKIEEIQERIQRLKQEYRAYLHKLRALEPDLNAASSWADRPYDSRKRRAANSDTVQEKEGDADVTEEPKAETSSQGSKRWAHIRPLSTPVLRHMPPVVSHYTFDTPAPLVWNVNPDIEDEPLQFAPPSSAFLSASSHHSTHTAGSSSVGNARHLKASSGDVYAKECSVDTSVTGSVGDCHDGGNRSLSLTACLRTSVTSRQMNACDKKCDSETPDSGWSRVGPWKEDGTLSGVAMGSGFKLNSKDVDSLGTVRDRLGFLSTQNDPIRTSAKSDIANASSTDCSRIAPVERSTSGAGQNDPTTDLAARYTSCDDSAAYNDSCSIRWNSVSVLSGSAVSSDRNVPSDSEDKAINTSLASQKQGSEGSSSSRLMQCENRTSLNPLNLDYSDSSDDNV